ncbi:MAG: VanZ family protein [Chloroflexi bacterium]|nr:VanZ family protein [Chloroflexota bacterium]
MDSKAWRLTLAGTLLWAGFLVYLMGAIPALPEMTTFHSNTIESLGHYLPFLVMGALVYSTAGAVGTCSSLRPYTAAMAITLSIAIGLSLESAQVLLPERGVEASDALFGASGAVVGVWAASLIMRRRLGRAALLVVAVSIVMVALAL